MSEIDAREKLCARIKGKVKSLKELEESSNPDLSYTLAPCPCGTKTKPILLRECIWLREGVLQSVKCHVKCEGCGFMGASAMQDFFEISPRRLDAFVSCCAAIAWNEVVSFHFMTRKDLEI